MNIGIYKITNHLNEIYIGQSMNLNYRQHVYKRLRCKSQPKIFQSILNYGWETHTFEIIELCEISELNKKERFYQELYNSVEKGLNSIYVGVDGGNRCWTEEMKDKLRKPKPNGFGEKLSKTLLEKGDSHASKQIESRNKRRETHYKKVDKHPLVKPVIQYDMEGNFVNEYFGTRDAYRKTGISYSHIGDVCLGKRKSAGKFIWKYKNQIL